MIQVMRNRLLAVVGILVITISAYSQEMSPGLQNQIRSLMADKAARTPVQRKIDPQLIYAGRMHAGKRITNEVATLETDVVIGQDNKTKVEIKGKVTPKILSTLKTMGAEIVFASDRFEEIVARVPINNLESLAGLNEVKQIMAWMEPILNNEVPGKTSPQSVSDDGGPVPPGYHPVVRNTQPSLNSTFTGNVVSEADITHKVAIARKIFGVSGAGVKIGVLSDGVTGYAASQASGDLPAINILPGQAGNSGSEGRAMLELIHDLLPDAELYFATAFNSVASFAQNIIDLRTAGCDIIVDDVSYFNEGVFQDGPIARAVNTVTADGAMYFSSAGNSGNKNDGTAGVWEGDFVNGGSVSIINAAGGGTVSTVASFGAQNYNVLTVASSNVTLKWSDPLGASNNDYDLVATNAAGTVVTKYGGNAQTGTQDPYESITTVAVNSRIYIVNYGGTAATRAMHLNTNRGRLSISTPGIVYGHNAAANTITVAATPASTAFGVAPNPVGPFPGIFTSANTVELFSSDGPRRIFYYPNGTAITPGNILFGTNGGTLLQKPDITAADGTLTTVSGFIPFFGTSAAAPHAAAIAGLIKSKFPGYSSSQILDALKNTAIDIETPGVDRDAGYGIIMAVEALASTGAVALSDVSLGAVSTTEGSYGNGNGVVEPGELAKMIVNLVDGSPTTATSVLAVLTCATPGITITKGSISYGDIAGYGSASNASEPFTFGVNNTVICGSTVNFTLTVSFGGGISPQVFTIPVLIGKPFGILSSTLGSTPPTGMGYSSATGLQTGRLNRFAPSSTCGTLKPNPGLFASTGSRAFDSYTLTNSMSLSQCVTVTLNANNGVNMYLAAYNSSGYNPASPATNFLADQGASSATQTFSFDVPAGQTFTLVVTEVSTGLAVNSPYTLNVSLVSCTPPPACTPVVVAAAGASTLHAPYSQTLSATGGSGAYTFGVTGTLPAGIVFNGTALTGAATETGSFPITITATDLTGCPSGTWSGNLVINCPSITVLAPTVTQPTCTMPNGTIVVNASTDMYNTLEYSVNAGNSYQAEASFGGLMAPADYNISVRVVGSTCTATYAGNPVSLVSGDGVPPVITTKPNPVASLWAPNHKYETITVAQCIASVYDNCGGISIADVVITSVTSDEPEDAAGDADGMTLNDIVISSDCKSVDLRKERYDGGNGRVYTIHFAIKDINGITGTASCKVYVAPNQNASGAIDNGAAYSVESSCSQNFRLISQTIAKPSIIIGNVKLQNFPNPFDAVTTIRFQLPVEAKTSLDIYNSEGQKVAQLVNGKLSAGWHNVIFDATRLSTGLYLYKLQTTDTNGHPISINGKMIKGK